MTPDSTEEARREVRLRARERVGLDWGRRISGPGKRVNNIQASMPKDVFLTCL